MRYISTLVFFLILFISCQETPKNKSVLEKVENLFILNSGEDEIILSKYDIYWSQKGGVYVYIKDEKVKNEVEKSKIMSISFKTKDTIYNGKVLNLIASRELDVEPFIIYVDNVSRKLDFRRINEKEMFFIGAKDDLDEFLKKENIDLKKTDNR